MPNAIQPAGISKVGILYFKERTASELMVQMHASMACRCSLRAAGRAVSYVSRSMILVIFGNLEGVGKCLGSVWKFPKTLRVE